jgi:hypothetical protein
MVGPQQKHHHGYQQQRRPETSPSWQVPDGRERDGDVPADDTGLEQGDHLIEALGRDVPASPDEQPQSDGLWSAIIRAAGISVFGGCNRRPTLA